MPPSRCAVTIAGYSFMVTVSAPKAPCTHTQPSVASAHQRSAPPASPRRCASQRAAASTHSSTPTAVAR